MVDAHVHFWDPQRLDYPWLAEVPALQRAFLPADYARANQNATAQVAKMIFVECGCAAAHTLEEVQWVSELAAREPRLQGIVAQAAVELGQRVKDGLAELARQPLVKGVRRNLQGETDPDFCRRPDFVAGVRALAAHRFTFDLCIIHPQLPAVTELVRQCPEVQFILDHCGKPAIRDGQREPWRQHLRELASLPNVACKISGLVTEASPARCGAADLEPWVAHAVEVFGLERVLFGGDWPVCQLATPFADWLASLQTILSGVAEASLVKVFQTNAERIYRV